MSASLYSENSNAVLDEELRILMVDDDPVQNAFASAYLGSKTTEVLIAASGAEGLQKLATSKVDFILVDFDMPGMNGLEFIEAVRAIPSLASIPIIMVTGKGDTIVLHAAFDAGANFYERKPIDWKALAQLIKFHLRKSREKLAYEL